MKDGNKQKRGVREIKSIEGRRFKKSNIRILVKMSLAVICFMLLFTGIGVVSATIIGTPPNPTGDTIIDQDTVWDGENNIHCGGDVIVGDETKRIYFDITNSHVTVDGKWTMGGDTPVNFTLLDSTIFFDVISGEVASQPKDAMFNREQIIVVESTSEQSKASRIELRNSIIKGTDYSHLAGGMTIKTGAFGNAKHTLIVDTVTFAYVGGAIFGVGDTWALNTMYWGTSELASDSSLTNITLDYCGRGIQLCNNIGVDYVTANGGYLAFFAGEDWNHLTMNKTIEGLYNPADGAWIRNSWFDAGETKFNIMSASDVTFEYNTVVLASCQAGSGSYPEEGNNNVLQHNTFIQTSIIGVKTGLKVIDNTFDRGQPSGGDTPISCRGQECLIADNTITGGSKAIRLKPQPDWFWERTGGHVITNNIIDGSHSGIYIEKQDGMTVINNTITDISLLRSSDGYGIKIVDCTDLMFRDNSITNTGRFDIAFGGSEGDLYGGDIGPSSNVKFINTQFDESKVHFVNAEDVFNNYYYLDVKVEDSNGNPIQGATVTITNDVDGGYPAINANGETKTSFITGANGHTPQPSDLANTLAILDYWQTKTERREMGYTITVEKEGNSNSTTVNPDSSWYRSNPNTYQNTVTIVLPTTIETGNISGTVTNSSDGTQIKDARVEVGAWYDDTDENGEYTISNIPVGTYTITASADGYENASELATVIADQTITVNFELTTVGDTISPTTNVTITPPPNEAGWNNATPVVVTFLRSDSGGSGISYTNFSKTSETGPWTMVNIGAAMGPDAGNVTDISEDGFNVTIIEEGITEIWYYSVDTNTTSNVETIKNVTVKIDTTPPASISDLQNNTGTTWINWTWNNPLDNDFSHTMVYLDGVFKTNTSFNHYNATSLTPNTTYEIGTHTVDTPGNTNTTWVNQTTKTSTVPNSPPIADPKGPYTGMEGVPTHFNGSDSYDTDGSIVAYEWDFGDGNTSSEVNPTHTYTQNGTYTVALTVTDNDGATDTNTTMATIADTELAANFSATPTSGEEPLTVKFTDNSTSHDGLVAWEWDFDNDSVTDSTTQNPTYVYAEDSAYTVSLKVRESDGDSDTMTKSDYITVTKVNNAPFTPANPSPYDGATDVPVDADLSWTGGDPDAEDTVTYDVYFGTNIIPLLVAENHSGTTYDPGRLDYSTGYYWQIVAKDDHGASNESGVWSFTTTASPGTDLVGLWHFDEGTGEIAADSSEYGNDGILVNDPIRVDGKHGKALSFDGVDAYVDCGHDASLAFTDSDPWTFEHWIKWTGQPSDSYVFFAGTSSAIECFTIKWNNNNQFGYRDKTATYHSFGANSADCCVNVWSHIVWMADGDGNLSLYINGAYFNTITTPTQLHFETLGRSWSFNVYMYEGAIDEVKIYNRALSAEEIRANYEAGLEDTIPPGSISNLQNTSSTTWINWTWTNPVDNDFSHTKVYLDGILQTNTSFNHYNATSLTPNTTYEIGTHTVDTPGNTNTTWVNQTTKTSTVPNSPPIADPKGPYTGMEGVPTHFNGSDSYDTDGSIVAYEWDFGDGNTSSEVNPTHTYTQNGTYTVALTVTDNDGATDTNTTMATIADTELAANFSATPTSGEEPLTVKFTDNSTSHDGLVAWEWDFDNDSVTDSTTQNPTYVYAEDSAYTVSLKVRESDGDSDTMTKSDYITVTKVNNAPFTPANPSPSDGATDVPVDADLSWTGGDPDAEDTVTYDVYFGTNIIPLLVAENHSGTTYDPGRLDYSTEYYWQIVAKDDHGASNESGVWSFTTTASPGTDLVGLWHFDEGTGEIAADSSEYGNDGILVNDPIRVDGKHGKALSFDGVDAYVDCGHDASLAFTDSDPWTFEHWIKWTGQPSDSYVFFAGKSSAIECFTIKWNNNNQFGYRDKTATYHSFGANSADCCVNVWSHIVWMADGDGNLSLYINGAYFNTITTPTQLHFETLGRSWSFNVYMYEGAIDEVKIYNRALSAEEIRANYEAGLEDTIPPGSISNLQNTSSTTWINWTWTNPVDNDFSHTKVYLDGILQTNTSFNHYNATSLTPNTTYEIGTHTVDTPGNTNTTWVNQTTKTSTVPNSPPIADPEGPYTGMEGVPTHFNGSDSYDTDGSIVAYEWDFGDGNTSSEVNPTHTYTQNGTYTVALTVTDNDGATDTNTTMATIADTELAANFSATPTSGEEPLTVKFTDNSTSHDGLVAWEWDFDNDSVTDSTTQNPTYVYAEDSAYTVSLKVRESDGDSDTMTKSDYITVTKVNNAPFTPANPSPSDGATDVPVDADLSWTGGDPDAEDTVTYDVYFGTNIIPLLVAENHSGTTYDPGRLDYSTEYYWRIMAKDNHGTSNESGVWSFTTTASPGTDLVGLWHFDEGTGEIAADSSEYGNDGILVNDPIRVNGKHGKALSFDGVDAYVDCGHDASLAFTDSDPWTFEHWIKWTGQPSDSYVFFAGKSSAIECFTIKWNNNNQFGYRDKTATYHSFGANSADCCVNVWSHIVWMADGDGNLSLYINGAYFNTITTPTQLHFETLGRSWSFNVYMYEGAIDEVKIYNRALSAEEIRANYEAGLEDTIPPGSISNLQNTSSTTWINWTWTNPVDNDFSHTKVYLDGIGQANTSDNYYNATGLIADTSYEIGTRTVATTGNVNSTWVNQTTKTLTVPNSPPVADPNGPYTGMEVVPILFNGSGSYDPDASIVSYLWTFGDGNNATGATPTHTYTQNGTYTVTLTVTDNDGATNTSTTTATIADTEPVADFSASPISGQKPLTVNFNDNSTSYDGIVAWHWDFNNDSVTDSTTQNQTFVYAEEGVYTVSLIVNESDGDCDTMTKADYITVTGVNNAPYTPANPSPSDGAMDVPVDDDLSWTGGDPDAEDTVTYNVYFGTSINPPLVAENQSGTTYDPGRLDYSTEYYWRIMAKDNHGTSNESGVWSFTTKASPGTDLVGLWHLDEGTGTLAMDSSGNGNDGTLVNDPIWVDGKLGKALSFDGVADYVDCGHDASLDITDEITIMVLVKPNVAGEGGPNAGPVCKAEAGVDWSWQLRYNAPDGGNYMGFQFNGVPEGSTWVSVKQDLSPGDWYHIAGTFDGTTIKCYLNGIEKDTNQISAITSGNSTFFIGQDGWNNIFNGITDEVKIYNWALGAEEIRADYEAGASNSPPVSDSNGPYTGTEGITTTFKGGGSYDPDGSIVAYEWDLGDGTTGTGVNPTHTYAQDGIYTVTLTVTDNDGATNTSTTAATIADAGPTADFSAAPTSGQEPLTVTFNDNSASYDGIVTWDWDFDNDGATESTAQNPTHEYTEDGVYTVSLTVTESDGDSDSMTKTDYITVIKVNQPPVSDPNGHYTGTEGVAIAYDGSTSLDPDGSIDSYEWDFGDGHNAIGVAPTHIYTQNDIYNVTLTVIDNDGATNTSITNATIANTKPTVDFSATPTSGKKPLTVAFTDNSTSYDGIMMWEWDFDNDGVTDSTVQNPTYEYTEDGVYTVSLKVSESDGDSDSMTKTDYITVIKVNQPPVSDPNGPYTGTEGVPIAYDGSTSLDPDGSIDSYEWDFGDGHNAIGVAPTHTYAQNGTYTVTLTVTDNEGATNTSTTTATIADTEPEANFSATSTSGQEPLTVAFTDNSTSYDGIVAWAWDFDNDGVTGSTEQNPTHVYAEEGVYTVSLTVNESDGDSNTMTKADYITVTKANQPPISDPNGPYTGTEGVPIAYDGIGSYDTDGSIVAYEWDFGDGTTATGVAPTHTCAQNGTYTVTLTVTDNEGATNTSITTATIADTEPTADFSATPTSGQESLTVNFTDNSISYDGIITWDWDFDNDGVTDSTEQNPAYEYTEGGVYTVSLTITESDGDSGSMTKADYITVTRVNQPPVSDPNGPYTGTEGVAIAFDGSTSLDPDGSIVAYEWDFGDGTTATGVAPTHTYAQDGIYTVTLTVTDNDGATNTNTTTATIADTEPVADFSATPISGQEPLTVNFTDNSVSHDGIIAWEWDFDNDGVTDSTEQNPTHVYAEEGRYSVSLKVYESDGDSDTMTKTGYITVIRTNQPPVADSSGPYTGTEGMLIAYDGSGSYDPDGSIVAYEWDFGDGDTSSEVTPTHIYAQDGTYNVTLTVTDNDDETNTSITTATIADTEPVADFTATPTSGLSPLTVAFTDASTSHDGIEAWNWDFDSDGETDSTEQNPTHVYAEEGVYIVSLTVTESDEDSDTMTKTDYITVTKANQPPISDPNGPYTGTEGVAIAFDCSTSLDPDGSIVAYEWDFGDGTTATGVAPTHTYAQDGIYTVTLTVTDNDGATNTNTTTATIADTESTADFSATPISGQEPLTVTFTDNSTSHDGIIAWGWDFDSDSVTESTEQNPTHEYTEDGVYSVCLTVTESDGDSNTKTKTDYITVTRVNQPPVSDPNGPYTGTEGVPLAFDGSTSLDPDGSIVAYEWDFCDGNTGTGVAPTHIYAQNETYTVTLTVTDNDGATNTSTTTATIADTGPTAAFSATPTSGQEPLTVAFTDTSTSHDGIEAWSWDFDNDGVTDSTEQNPTHVYAEEGVYTVSLTVTESDGDNDTMTKTDYITVTRVNQPPVSDPNGPYTGTEGVAIAFDGSTSLDPDGSIVAYEWDFGDGSTATGVAPTHTCAQNGTYTVTLTVTDNDGATNTSTTTATIADTEPTADFSATPTSGQESLTVNFTDNSTSHDGIITWDWDFDNDGVTDSTEQNPAYEYTEGGVYTVSLTITESDGDSGSMTKMDYIMVTKANEPPVSDPSGP